MSINSTLVAALTANVGVTSKVSTNIYHIETTEQLAVPYVVYEVISGPVPVQHNGGGKELFQSVVQIACYGANPKASREIALAVHSCLINGLQAAVIEDSEDQRDSDTRRKSIVQTYRIWHEEDQVWQAP